MTPGNFAPLSSELGADIQPGSPGVSAAVVATACGREPNRDCPVAHPTLNPILKSTRTIPAKTMTKGTHESMCPTREPAVRFPASGPAVPGAGFPAASGL